MMRVRWTYFIAALLAVACVACKEHLTSPTTSGNGTLSFLVDGQIWKPSIFLSPSDPTLIVDYDGKTLSVQAAKGNEGGGSEGFSFGCSGLRDSAGLTIEGVDFANAKGHFFHRAPGPQEIVITRFDTVQKIVSGRFTFTLADQTDTNIVHITEGRFDLHYPMP